MIPTFPGSLRKMDRGFVCVKACYDILREDDGEISNESSLPR